MNHDNQSPLNELEIESLYIYLTTLIPPRNPDELARILREQPFDGDPTVPCSLACLIAFDNVDEDYDGEFDELYAQAIESDAAMTIRAFAIADLTRTGKFDRGIEGLKKARDDGDLLSAWLLLLLDLGVKYYKDSYESLEPVIMEQFERLDKTLGEIEHNALKPIRRGLVEHDSALTRLAAEIRSQKSTLETIGEQAHANSASSLEQQLRDVQQRAEECQLQLEAAEEARKKAYFELDDARKERNKEIKELNSEINRLKRYHVQHPGHHQPKKRHGKS